MSYKDTKKWLENNFSSTYYILKILHWVGGACQALGQMAKQKLNLTQAM